VALLTKRPFPQYERQACLIGERANPGCSASRLPRREWWAIRNLCWTHARTDYRGAQRLCVSGV